MAFLETLITTYGMVAVVFVILGVTNLAWFIRARRAYPLAVRRMKCLIRVSLSRG